MSGTFNVGIESDAKPVTWSQNTGNSSTASTGTNTSTDPESTASPTPSSKTTAGAQASESNGLSQGAKIGIGVGVALGVLALIAPAAAFYVLRQRRNMNKRRTESSGPESEAHNFATPHPNATEYAASKATWSEMPVDEKVHEKDSAPVATGTLGELEAPRY